MNIALIFAGGTGQRMNTKTKPKQFLELNGKPIIIHTIDHFENHPMIDAIAIVCLQDWIPQLKSILAKFHIEKVRWIVPGGESGQMSIKNGLRTLSEDPSVPDDAIVLIHDGVRPLINEHTVSQNIACAIRYGNAITAVPATETIINVTEKEEVANILDRDQCMMARAPQTFRLSDILSLHKRAEAESLTGMIDSAMLASHYGVALHVVEGPFENIKITTPSDYYVFRAFYEAKENSQIWGL